MSVIVELTLPATEFELGRILHMEGETSIVLETMVPLGERSIPFFRLRDGRDAFEGAVSDHPAVADVHAVNSHDGETLYALDWRIGADSFFDCVMATDAHVLEASGTARRGPSNSGFPPTGRSRRSGSAVPTPASPSRSSGSTTPRIPIPASGTG